MGVGHRVFFVDDNDSLQRISMSRLDRLLHFDRRETLRQHAGKRVRCAMVFLEVDGRQILSIRNIDYFVIHFGAKGRIDKKEWEKGMRIGMKLLPFIPNEELPKKVIHAQHRFAGAMNTSSSGSPVERWRRQLWLRYSTNDAN